MSELLSTRKEKKMEWTETCQKQPTPRPTREGGGGGGLKQGGTAGG